MNLNRLQNFWAATNKPNLIPFNIFPAGLDLSWIDDNHSSSGAAPTVNDLSGQTGTVFTLTGSPSTAEVVRNGQTVRQADSVQGFSIVGSTLTLVTAKGAGETLVVYWWL